MRYDAYRLPGVRWRWVGVGKSPEPDHWPEHVSLEGVRVKTIRGKGWGIARALYECPECGKARVRLYSSSDSVEAAGKAVAGRPWGEYAHQAADRAERTRTPVRVACASHWPASKVREDDALLAEARADVMARNYRWRPRARILREQAARMRLAPA